MADILLDLPIKAPAERVFDAITTPTGLDAWWTQRSAGNPVPGTEYDLWFGPDYDWRAQVTRCVTNTEWELQLVRADPDWFGTRVGFRLEPRGDRTLVRFHHTGWPEPNDHHRTSVYCWGMYLRLLRRYVEHGEHVPYDERLDA
jgi:uncharacterized protein YndB with AHSA1/START domain